MYIIRLNRPETKNAFNQQLYDEICLSLMAAEEDDRVVMVRFFRLASSGAPPLTALPRVFAGDDHGLRQLLQLGRRPEGWQR